MNELALRTIAAFANAPAPGRETNYDHDVENRGLYLAALDALALYNEWLQDPALVQSILDKLETIESRASETGRKTRMIYNKITNAGNLQQNIHLQTVRVRTSAENVIDIPKHLLLVEGAHFQIRFNGEDAELDLSHEASPDTLTQFARYLCSGEADINTSNSAVELLLLAKSHGLRDLSMKCLEHILHPHSRWADDTGRKQQQSPEEAALRSLLVKLRMNSIYIVRDIDIPHVRMNEGTSPENWECVAELHDYFAVTHLELSERKDLALLKAFAQQNPQLVSLNMGPSEDVTDEYLEELSTYLLNLDAIHLNSKKITTIPDRISSRVRTLSCTNCYALTAINAPLATTLAFDNCSRLTTIYAPSAAWMDCNSCNELTTINMSMVKTLFCRSCNSLTNINAPLATSLTCIHNNMLATIDVPLAVKLTGVNNPALTDIHAPAAIVVSLHHCDGLRTLNAPSAIAVNCAHNRRLEAIYTPLAKRVEIWGSVALRILYVPLASTLRCDGDSALTALNAPSAEHLACNGHTRLKAINAPLAITLECHSCVALTAVNAPLATSIRRTGSRQVLSTVAPALVWMLDKMPTARQLNQADHYDAIGREMAEHEPEQCRDLILECEFKAKLLRNENVRNYVEPLTEMLRDPATAEKVVGEVADLSKWAKEVGGHEHLAQWLFNLKENMRRTVEVVHTQATNRLLLREQYTASRKAQNQRLRENTPEINLSLFLNNPRLRRDLRDLYAATPDTNLEQLHDDLSRALDIQLPMLHPGEQDHSARKARVLSLFRRLQLTKDYEIDPESVSKRLAAVVNSLCAHRTARNIERNMPYLNSVLAAIEEGAEQCHNRAADALSKAEEVYFQKRFKNDRQTLYGIVLMQWKRRFLEQYVRLETMPVAFGRGEGAGWDVEIIMENCQIYNDLLDLNLDIKDVFYLENIKRHLAERDADGQEIANPQDLFKALIELTTPDKLLDLCLRSPVIQKLHGVDATILETPEDVRVNTGILLASWGKPLVEGAEEFKDSLDKLEETLGRYQEMEGFAELRTFLEQSMAALRSVYATGNGYDIDKEIEVINGLQIALSNMHDAYQQRAFNHNASDSFRERVIRDLIDAGFLLLPQQEGAQLVLEYAEPSSIVVDPNVVIEATLQLNVEDWPVEFRDAEENSWARQG